MLLKVFLQGKRSREQLLIFYFKNFTTNVKVVQKKQTNKYTVLQP